MVEWTNLAVNGLWVVGMATILAAFSLACHEAQRRGERLRMRLTTHLFQLSFAIGTFLISLGAALIGPRWWERLLWALLGAVSAQQFWANWREWRRET